MNRDYRDSAAVDTMTADQAIRDGDTLVSAGEMFELGFFSPGNSKNRYLGIWYNKISPQTVVWVANRETPITDTLGVFKVSHEGTLMVLSGGDTVVWSSESSVSVRNISPVTQLLDSGNLVVRNEGSMDQETLVWQSFDYPGDTHLPGMKLGKDLVTGLERRVVSWKSPDDPSPGEYVNYVDTNGFPQMTQRRGSVITFRVGPWNGLRFSGFPTENQNPIFTNKFVFNQEEIYDKFDLINSSHLSRVHLNPEGSILRLNWLNHTQGWFLNSIATVDTCARYGFCGPYGFCDDKNSPLCSCSHYGLCGPYGSCDINTFPTCSCMEGFEPTHPDEWNVANWSSGCRRKKPLDCGNEDGFRKISGVKFPDTEHSWYNLSMTLGECKMACKRNCSCTAYANVDIRSGGSGCLLWFDELMDVRAYNETQDIYIKMAASELSGLTVSQYGFNQKIRVLTVALPISSVGLVLLGSSVAVVYACRKKKKRSVRKGQGRRVHTRNKHRTNVQNEDIELPFFSLSKIAKATNNFSIDNKLGEGGFGPVYKGVLEEGQKVAVKRLSRTSQQGIDEFKNEVTYIAKLQHRNLVKLLGYCIHGDEMILIYEYMANKSLDSFLFDETRSPTLDWPLRFCIIHGIARGILYLHQDSRLRIIHRDLKASNILLDDDMMPKISDFGLARMLGANDTTAKTKKVVGTHGYISPEYAVHGRFSVKSDVFSFGVLVLEIVSGQKNTGFSHDNHSDNLLGHAWRLYKEDKCLELMNPSLHLELMNPSLHDSCIISEVTRSIHVGLLCVQNHAQDRPTMSSVVMMLGGEGVLPPPKQPAFFTEESSSEFRVVASSVDEATITLVDAR